MNEPIKIEDLPPYDEGRDGEPLAAVTGDAGAKSFNLTDIYAAAETGGLDFLTDQEKGRAALLAGTPGGNRLYAASACAAALRRPLSMPVHMESLTATMQSNDPPGSVALSEGSAVALSRHGSSWRLSEPSICRNDSMALVPIARGGESEVSVLLRPPLLGPSGLGSFLSVDVHASRVTSVVGRLLVMRRQISARVDTASAGDVAVAQAFNAIFSQGGEGLDHSVLMPYRFGFLCDGALLNAISGAGPLSLRINYKPLSSAIHPGVFAKLTYRVTVKVWP